MHDIQCMSNPSLTYMALTARAADSAVEMLQEGEYNMIKSKILIEENS